jgi:hypothetical protein
MNWKNYDNWKLRSPEDDRNEPEIFETRQYNLFSTNENDVNSFDDAIKNVDESHKDFNRFDYSDFNEFLHECIENFSDEFNLHDNQDDAIIKYFEDIQDEKEYQEQIKIDRIIEERRNK